MRLLSPLLWLGLRCRLLRLGLRLLSPLLWLRLRLGALRLLFRLLSAFWLLLRLRSPLRLHLLGWTSRRLRWARLLFPLLVGLALFLALRAYGIHRSGHQADDCGNRHSNEFHGHGFYFSALSEARGAPSCYHPATASATDWGRASS